MHILLSVNSCNLNVNKHIKNQQSQLWNKLVINLVDISSTCFFLSLLLEMYICWKPSFLSFTKATCWKVIHNTRNYPLVEKLFNICNRKSKGTKTWSQSVMFSFHQNPANCTATRKVIIEACKHGYGSQIHRLAAALSFAMYTNRTLIFDDSKFGYIFSPAYSLL